MLLLSCVWNFQLSEHTLATTECSPQDALVTHWNTKAKAKAAVALAQRSAGGDAGHVLASSDLRAFLNAYEVARRVDGAALRTVHLQRSCRRPGSSSSSGGGDGDGGGGRSETQGVGSPSASAAATPSPSTYRHNTRGAGADEEEEAAAGGGGGIAANGVAGIATVPVALRNACPREYIDALQAPLQVHPYFLDFDARLEEASEITLVTHFSLQRLEAFLAMADAWQGPISAAVFVSEHDAFTVLHALELTNVALHVVYQELWHSEGLYPINRLRNIAISFARTPFYFHVDVDFSFRADLAAVLLRHTRAVALGELGIEVRV